MTATHPLHSLTAEALSALLRSRPELLDVQPPESLRELWARLCHPPLIRRALEQLDLPTLQVAEVLAAVGDRPDHVRGRAARIAELLGIAFEPSSDGSGADAGSTARSPAEVQTQAARRSTLDRALVTLRARFLIDPSDPDSARLVPGARQLWEAPLGLGPGLRPVAEGCTAEQLRAVLVTLDERPPARKAEMVDRVVSVLSDGDRVRGLMANCPQPLLGPLMDVAYGRAVLEYHGWYSPRVARSSGVVHNPVEWAIDRLLLVRRDWHTTLLMPAEVAMALRGSGWRAPLATEPPTVTWRSLPERSVTDAATAATATALRTMTALLTGAGTRPVPLLKSGAVGVRELRRLAQTMGCSPAQIRLCLELARRLRLLSFLDDAMAPTAAFDSWIHSAAADRYAQLLRAWLALPEIPHAEGDIAWGGYDEGITADGADGAGHRARRAVLAVLAEHPQAAPESPVPFTHRVLWNAPLLLGAVPHDTGWRGARPDTTQPHAHHVDPDRARTDQPQTDGDGVNDGGFEPALRLVTAVLSEAAWLGVTGLDALSPAGAALVAGHDIATTVGATLGSARTQALLGSDLTAVVLGEPDVALAAALDRMADRENSSTAGVWRFSPASVRRALDAGADADSVLDDLEALAEGTVPQPLIYLVRDVARRHGRLRVGAVACYIRSDDTALLAELVRDRTLRRLGLHQVAATVLVGALPLPETLQALRRAGHAPVQEAPDGATVVRAERHHRAQPLHDEPLRVAAPHTTSISAAEDAVAALAARLLAAPDEPAGLLVQIGPTVVAVRPEARRRHDVPVLPWS